MTTTDPAPRHRAAVIGSPVAHSLSPVLHRAAYADLGLEGWEYAPRDVAPGALAGVLAELAAPCGPGPVWAGLSVTMPHKQAMLPALDVVDPLAAAVGAANTVVAQRSGTGPALLAGFNTDVAGVVGALRETGGGTLRAEGGTALILGSGATACSALAALAELGAARIIVAARNHAGPRRAASAARRMGLEIEAPVWRPDDPRSNRQVARAMARAQAVVSTVTAGAADVLAPALAEALDGEPPDAGAVLLDVVYDPWPTALAAAWRAGGGAVAPGWLMLLHQAAPQVGLMTGRRPRLAPMRAALAAALDARSRPAPGAPAPDAGARGPDAPGAGREPVGGSAPCCDG